MKIIFDRSAFHGHRFDLLKGSRLLQLTRERKLLVFHTTVFVEETLRMVRLEERKGELRRQWPFLVSICNGGWFKELQSVCEEELDGGEKAGDWLLVPDCQRSRIEAALTRCFEKPEPPPELEEVWSIYDQIKQKKEQNWDEFVALQQQPVPENQRHLPLEPFAQYYQSNADEFASRVICQLPALDQPERKLDAWRRDPQKFPHFTAYVQLYAYIQYDPQRYKNSSIDKNCVEDAQQLCFLEDVDAMVSSDGGFMRRAFDEVWRPLGKGMFTPEEFAAFSEGC